MIDGNRITKALEKLMAKSVWYDPDEASASCKLPVTMRDLIEFNFEGMVGYDDDERHEIRRINWPAASQPKLSVLPIHAGDLNRKLPGDAASEIPEIEMDYRGDAPVLAAFYRWLQINEPNNNIDVDHPLEGHGYDEWPLWVYFTDMLKEKTGYILDDVFINQIEMEMNYGEPAAWDHIILPLYDIGAGDDDVPLIEFLNEFTGWRGKNVYEYMPEFPQAVYELSPKRYDHSKKVESARLIFRNLLHDGEIELLDKNWAAALAGLDKYGDESISYVDRWDDAMLQVDGSPADIDRLFKKLSRIRKMREAVDPLIDEYMDDCEKLWKKLLEKLHAIAAQHPSLAKNIGIAEAKTLIEVLA